MNACQTSVKLIAVKDGGSLIDSVIALADRNWDTLGFIPGEALRRAARKGEILASVSGEGTVFGYAWYSVTRSSGDARIHHLCIDAKQRRSGVGRSLVDAVKQRTQHLRGITLRCRRDFKDACNFWRHVGFVPLSERKGRGKEQKVLTCFRFEHGHPNLWTEHYAHLAQTKAVAVLDANVFFDLQDEASPSYRESRALQADWIQALAALWITEELHNEIDRHENAEERRRRQGFAQGFPVFRPDQSARDRALAAVNEVLPPSRSESDESDRHHLAAASAGNADFFITRDGALLQAAPQVAEKLTVSVVSPLEFILELDELQRKWHYQPARLAGSALTIQVVAAGDVPVLGQRFMNHGAGENKGEFERRLRGVLADPSAGRGFIVRDGDGNQAVMALADHRSAVDIAVLRVRPGKLGPTLACHLACRAVADAVRNGRSFALLSDPHRPAFVGDACAEVGFIGVRAGLVKTIMRGVNTVGEAASMLVALRASHDDMAQLLDGMASSLGRCRSSDCSTSEIAQAEHLLWPLKLDDERASSFMVPIEPEWAKHLFDERLAAQGLFAVDTFLSLQYENVYYRAARPQIVTAPGRVLWYVSEDRQYQGTAQIRACSAVEDVVVGPARALFRQFRRLGVYQWKDVLSLAKGNPDGEIMAFRFAGTEALPHPVSRDVVRDVLRTERDDVTPQFTTALKLKPREFARIYALGIGQTMQDRS